MPITVFMAGGNDSRKSFVADAVMSVKETFTNQITSYPVDTRSNISDHVFNENPTISIVGSVSNHPVFEYPNNEVGYNNINRADEAHALLKELWFSRTPFDVVTEFDLFTNCILQTYTTDFTAQSMEALNFNCDIQVIRLAESQSITVTIIDSAKIGESGKGTTDNGAEQPTDLNDGKNHSQIVPLLNDKEAADAQYEANMKSQESN
jgi:hypothetical protein